jgi:hypothetical protein
VMRSALALLIKLYSTSYCSVNQSAVALSYKARYYKKKIICEVFWYGPRRQAGISTA